MRYPREIKARPAWRQMFLIAAIHLIAAISFIHLDQDSLWPYAGVAVACLSFALCLRAVRRRCGMCLMLEDSGSLRVLYGGADDCVCLQPSSVDFGWAVWLAWTASDAGRKRDAILILRADVPDDDWRALRIWFRHKAAPDASGEVSEA